jgi:hypothetical protein
MEGQATDDGTNPLHFAWIVEFRDGPVQRETISFAEPSAAPDWRKPWAEEGATWQRQPDLPARLPERS